MEARLELLERAISGSGPLRLGAGLELPCGSDVRLDDLATQEPRENRGDDLSRRVAALQERLRSLESGRPVLGAAHLAKHTQRLRVAALASDAEMIMLHAERLRDMHRHCEQIRALAATEGVIEQTSKPVDAVLAREATLAAAVAQRGRLGTKIRDLVRDYALWIDSVNAILVANEAAAA